MGNAADTQAMGHASEIDPEFTDKNLVVFSEELVAEAREGAATKNPARETPSIA